MALHRRSPRSLTHALAPFASTMAPETLLAEVQTVWSDAVGEQISREARPVLERAGTLTVSCSAAVWAHELELMSAELLTRLNARLTRGQISTLSARADGRP